jgi:hypothetical protein
MAGHGVCATVSVGQGSERIRFSSAILPLYARRSKSSKC